MRARLLFAVVFVFSVLLMYPTTAQTEDLKPIQLPQPRIDGGRPLMQVLSDRESTRFFSSEALPLKVMSDLLWAAFGINRPRTGHRTAPSASNRQEIDVYVALAEGLYLYDPKAHALKPMLAEDLRAKTGVQPFVGKAPVNLVYVADFSRMDGPDEDKVFYSAANTGFIAQNVYLYCASEGLGTVVRGLVNRRALARAMNLGPEQHVTLAQTVGYPK